MAFVEYEGKVIAKGDKGNYYELTQWNIGPDGEILPLKKRKLTIEEAHLILKEVDRWKSNGK